MAHTRMMVKKRIETDEENIVENKTKSQKLKKHKKQLTRKSKGTHAFRIYIKMHWKLT